MRRRLDHTTIDTQLREVVGQPVRIANVHGTRTYFFQATDPHHTAKRVCTEIGPPRILASNEEDIKMFYPKDNQNLGIIIQRQYHGTH